MSFPPSQMGRVADAEVTADAPSAGRGRKRKMADHWIKGAIKHPGALHKQLGVPEGEKIPGRKLQAALTGKYGAKAKKRANLAETLKRMH